MRFTTSQAQKQPPALSKAIGGLLFDAMLDHLDRGEFEKRLRQVARNEIERSEGLRRFDAVMGGRR